MMKVKKQKDSTFEVESSTKGKFYKVDIDAPSCSCPHWRLRLAKVHGECKHILAARDSDEKRDESTYSAILDFVRGEGAVDTVFVMEKFTQAAVDDLLSRGELVEEKGSVSLLQ